MRLGMRNLGLSSRRRRAAAAPSGPAVLNPGFDNGDHWTITNGADPTIIVSIADGVAVFDTATNGASSGSSSFMEQTLSGLTEGQVVTFGWDNVEVSSSPTLRITLAGTVSQAAQFTTGPQTRNVTVGAAGDGVLRLTMSSGTGRLLKIDNFHIVSIA